MTVVRAKRGLAVVVAMVAMGLLSGCAVFSGSEDEGNDQADWHYEMGQGYFESQDTTHAIRELSEAVKLDPDHADAHHLLGFIYMGRRDHQRAVHHFEETLRIRPEYYTAMNNLGSVFLAQGRWDEAAEVFEELVDQTLYTTPELAHNNLGWAYHQMGRHAEALEHLRRASYLAPEMCLADNNKGRVYQEMGNANRAERHFRRAIEKCPQDYQEPHYYLGRLMQDQGDDNASAHFQRCIEIRGHNDLAERCRQFLQLQ